MQGDQLPLASRPSLKEDVERRKVNTVTSTLRVEGEVRHI